MATYVILRRCAWRTESDLHDAMSRAAVEGHRAACETSWIRSYVLVERDQSFGTVCVHEATSPEAIRRHAAAAGLPIDEIVKVAEIVVVCPDPVPASV